MFWWKKNWNRPRRFYAKIINSHYCAMSQTLFWPPFWNGITFFKFYFSNVNLFMFFYFEPNFIEKFLWESGFSNFGHVTFFTKRKFVFWPPFWNGAKFFHFFSGNMVVISVCIYGVKIILKFRWESGFLWGVPWSPPYALTEGRGTLCS